MKIIASIAALAALATATTASAESFTSTYKNDPVTTILSPGATPMSTMLGAFWKGTTTSVSKSGVTTTASYTCVGWATPGQATDQNAVCDVAETPADHFTIQLACSYADPKNPTKGAVCWGGLVGTSGKYTGKTGQFAQYGDNVSGTAQGAWN
jgi:hypothetical protein